ncbi:hypothetical protein D4764_11G0007820 [Takifugu flavidus]|uniref:Uncharacterized protein n=1 Tax=Takifugu flavidus TaxID=433684 RepID=A0A5C6PIF1_9TELE|nr:hypothetical protein D4764_11G0007820 [Takifugu flavidus]
MRWASGIRGLEAAEFHWKLGEGGREGGNGGVGGARRNIPGAALFYYCSSSPFYRPPFSNVHSDISSVHVDASLATCRLAHSSPEQQQKESACGSCCTARATEKKSNEGFAPGAAAHARKVETQAFTSTGPHVYVGSAASAADAASPWRPADYATRAAAAAVIRRSDENERAATAPQPPPNWFKQALGGAEQAGCGRGPTEHAQ